MLKAQPSSNFIVTNSPMNSPHPKPQKSPFTISAYTKLKLKH